jgi:hypothetical protein
MPIVYGCDQKQRQRLSAVIVTALHGHMPFRVDESIRVTTCPQRCRRAVDQASDHSGVGLLDVITNAGSRRSRRRSYRSGTGSRVMTRQRTQTCRPSALPAT